MTGLTDMMVERAEKGPSLLTPVSRQGFAPQILAEQFTHFIRKLLKC
jgi:hypothetical protein